ncbi:Pyrophosphate phospho-hydrolase [Hyphodiscus hymeniophilus]|uniref:inorganic diphosphatase n=1 Tax=Hyphodiscus hymeniophilus TaxID=353542 RepID=A0A9P7AVQ0_9HELO|nr:Pyrophosphate phospho-hydrolase [Hyphodiscus hymeniophilus]
MLATEYKVRKSGQLNTPDFRIHFQGGGVPISSWHDIPLYVNHERSILNMIVEIPRWSNAKYEISRSEPLNPIQQDTRNGTMRFVHNIFPFKGYIWNYGALPRTWEDPSHVFRETDTYGDNDPLDALEIGEQVGYPGQIKQVKVIGVMLLLDEGETDWKVLVIDINDPLAPKLNSTEDVRMYYKVPDGKPENKAAFAGQFKEKDYATKVIQDCNESWDRLISNSAKHEGISLSNATVADSPHKIISRYLHDHLVETSPPARVQEHIDKFSYLHKSLKESV